MKLKTLAFIIVTLGIVYSIPLEAQLLAPQSNGTKYFYQLKDIYFEVDADYGGRINSLKHKNEEIMYVTRNYGDNFGSTFWTSPQSVWNWPPLTTINSSPYTAVLGSNYIRLSSGINTDKLKVSVKKEFLANPQDTSITIYYTIKNEGTTANSIAPWEITRVPAGGLMFFADAGTNPWGGMSNLTQKVINHHWFNYDQTKIPATNSKIFSDAKGWLGYVSSSRILFLKKFNDIASQNFAPSESEVEIYCDPGFKYTELENQGAYVSVPAGNSIVWRVQWFVRALPENVIASVGSESLIAYTTQVINNAIVTSDVKPENPKISIFPNPVTDWLFIEQTLNNGKLSIFNMQGSKVMEVNVITGSNKINVKELTNGVYFYNLTIDNQNFSGKFLK